MIGTKKIQENTITNLHKMYPKYDNKKLYDCCEKGCVALSEQSNVFSKQYEKSNPILKDIVKTYLALVKIYVDRLQSSSKLKQDHEYVCQQLESVRNYFYEQFEAPDEEAAATIMASMTVHPF